MTYKEINIFLSSFNTQSYNKMQIGSDKSTIISIYEFLQRLNLSDDKINELILHIAYLRKNEVNIPLFLEILSKSLSYEASYDLNEIVEISLRVHKVYEDNYVDLSEYVHEPSDSRLRKLFLFHNKYIDKTFVEEETLSYIDELKLTAAIELEQSEYKDFTEYFNNVKKNSYSPMHNLNTYIKLRNGLSRLTKLFFDIFFGNEYLVALLKNNVNIAEVYEKNFTVRKTNVRKEVEPTQLDIFTYQEVEEPKKVEEVNAFQISYIYDSKNIPEFEEEKDIVEYYKNLLSNKILYILPKLKNKKISSYVYETDLN